MLTFLTFINLNYHQAPEAPLKSHLAGCFSRQTTAEICQNCTKPAYNINISMILIDFLFSINRVMMFSTALSRTIVHPPPPWRTSSLWVFLRQTGLPAWTLCIDSFFYMLLGGGEGGAKCAKLHKCFPISGISCLHSCDAFGAWSDQWAFHSTSNYK